jgi:hypothetical protein
LFSNALFNKGGKEAAFAGRSVKPFRSQPAYWGQKPAFPHLMLAILFPLPISVPYQLRHNRRRRFMPEAQQIQEFSV